VLPPPPPPLPISEVSVRALKIYNPLLQFLIAGDFNSFESIIKTANLRPAVIKKIMEIPKFSQLNNRTIADYAVETSWDELCLHLSVAYGVQFSDEAKAFAEKKREDLFLVVFNRDY